MTDPDRQTEDAREADSLDERPDLGRTPDALNEALSGAQSASDTRAGSLQGGAASGSDADDQADINRVMTTEGMAAPGQDAEAGRRGGPQSPGDEDEEVVRNTGPVPGRPDQDPAEGPRDDDVDSATG